MAIATVNTYQPLTYQTLPHLGRAFDAYLEWSPQEIIEQKMM
jgi:hypothetical protein